MSMPVQSLACELRVHDQRRLGRPIVAEARTAGWADCWRPCGYRATGEPVLDVDGRPRQVCTACRRQLAWLAEHGLADQVRWAEPGWDRPAATPAAAPATEAPGEASSEPPSRSAPVALVGGGRR